MLERREKPRTRSRRRSGRRTSARLPTDEDDAGTDAIHAGNHAPGTGPDEPRGQSLATVLPSRGTAARGARGGGYRGDLLPPLAVAAADAVLVADAARAGDRAPRRQGTA